MAQLARGKSPSPLKQAGCRACLCGQREGQLQWSGLGLAVVIWDQRDMVRGPVTWVQWSAFMNSSRDY